MLTATIGRLSMGDVKASTHILSEMLPEKDCGCGITVPFGVTCPYCDPVTGKLDPTTMAPFFEWQSSGATQSGSGVVRNTSVPTAGKQICFLGDPSPDPLIPGVCNTTALAVIGAALAVAMFMGGRG